MVSRRFFLAGLPVLCLAPLEACTVPPPQRQFADITFEHRPDIKLDVGAIEIDLTYRAPLLPPNVEHLFPVIPADGAARWAADRLVAAGTGRRARFIVEDASVLERTLGATESNLTIEQSERYDARVAVVLQILDGSRVEGELRAEARRSITVSEDSSLNEREKVWYVMTERLLSDLDRELEKTIREIYAPYIVI